MQFLVYRYAGLTTQMDPVDMLSQSGHTAVSHDWDGDPETVAAPLREDIGAGIGAVWLPALWDDLRLVKCVENIQALDVPRLIVASGPSGGEEALAAAFNAGLTQWLTEPVTDEKLQLMMRRLEKTHTAIRRAQGVNAPTQSSAPNIESFRRDNHIGRALADWGSSRGPLIERTARVLYVCASPAQHQHVVRTISAIGIDVQVKNTLETGLDALREGQFNVLLCDHILDGGDALELIRRTRHAVKQRMPYTVVLSSSPEKMGALSDPAAGIDEILYKPSLSGKMEAILPAIVAGIYQTTDQETAK